MVGIGGKSMINIGIIGYGGMGSYHHKELIKQADGVQVIAAYDSKPERQTAAKKAGIVTYESFESLLSEEQIDAVLIATPNDVHKELAIQAMINGKHVICEKPAMLSTAELDEVIAVSKENNQVFMVHQNRRWDSDFLVIQNLYQKKQIGELFRIESRVHGANGIPGDWRHLEKHGGGMLLDWGVHLLDQLLFMVDSPVKKVSAELSYVLGDEVDDGFMALITFENGISALVEVGTTNFAKLPRWYVKGLAGTAVIHDWDLSGEIVKQTGVIDHHNLIPIKAGQGVTKTMSPPTEEATTTIPLVEVSASNEGFYKNFYAVVTNGAIPIVKNEEVREVLALIERIVEVAQN